MSEELELNIPVITDIPDGSLITVASHTGGGKTAFSTWLAFKKASEGEKVGVISHILHDREIYQRLIQFCQARDINVSSVVKNLFIKSSREDLIDSVHALIDETDIKVLVIDNFFVSPGDKGIASELKKIASKEEITIIMTAPLARNSQLPFGSSDTVADSDVFLIIGKASESESYIEAEIKILKNRFGETSETKALFKLHGFYEAA